MAIKLEVDSLDGIPAFQQSWYEQDPASKKFRLNADKVDVEDVTGLRKTVEETRKELKSSKTAAALALQEALKPYEGIDPVKVRELLGQFDDAEEAKLITKGKEGIEAIVEKRLGKHRTEFQKQLEAAEKKAKGAEEVASTFRNDVIDNKVRIVLEKAGMHASAIDDALMYARNIFNLDENRNLVQYDDNDAVVLGKDGKTPFSPLEWIETMKESKPHWFPVNSSGGGGGGGGKPPAGKTMKRTVFDSLPADAQRKAMTVDKVTLVD